MGVSIIIINYNTNVLTCNCINSIYSHTPSSIIEEIIVIDNNSNIEDPQIIKKKHALIKLIKLKNNEGFGRANNIGIKIAKGKHTLLLNSDTIIVDNSIEKAIYFFESDYCLKNNIGLIGCNFKNNDGSNQSSTFDKGSLKQFFINGNPILNKINRTLFKNKTPFDYDKSQFVPAVSGAFMLFKSSIFNRVKGFDPDIFMYSEDTELCRNRIGKLYSIYYYSIAKIIHLGGQSAQKNDMHYQNMLSFALTIYKSSIAKYFLFIIISFINFFSYLIVYPFTIEKNKLLCKLNINGFIKIAPQLIFDIPKYKRKWGSRPNPLILNSLKSN